MRPEAAGVGLPDRMNGMKSPECSDTMKITILGPAHPYRGGLASIMEIMARTFQRRGDEVDIKTFTLQYPSLLFPGESQTVATPPPRTSASPLRQYDESAELGARRPPDTPRASRFRADEVLDALHGPLFRDHCPHRPRQRPYEGADARLITSSRTNTT